MRTHRALLTAGVFAWTAFGQTSPVVTLQASSSIVTVPTSVRSNRGDLITNFRATDFIVTDDGIKQSIRVEKLANQDLAIVVLMQTGASAPLHFQSYKTLLNMLEITQGIQDRRVALITFDSRPREIWNFPPKTDGMGAAFMHPSTGSRGAAIIDAVDRAVDLLQEQSADRRRVILLLSQRHDAGSVGLPDNVMRRLAGSNSTLYSVAFTTKKNESSAPDPGGSCSESAVTQVNPSISPLIRTRVCDNTAAELALMTGGEQVSLKKPGDLKASLSLLMDDFSKSYLLSFRPTSQASGLHVIGIKLAMQGSDRHVLGRTAYWRP